MTSAVHQANQRDHARHRPLDFEATLEIVYRYQLAPWCSIQPHAQYVIHPGGTEESENALILGVRTTIAF